MKTQMIEVLNKLQGEYYYIESGEPVKYVGFIPKEGHIVRFIPDTHGEFTLPHDTKFYK
jgi:hypothetical protein